MSNVEWTGEDESNDDFFVPDLSGANLKFASLSKVNFFSTNLNSTDLYRADLTGADLSFASLDHANLREAELIAANLYGANLVNACLRDANLTEANLSDTELAHSNFENVFMAHTTIGSVDLSEVQNLESAKLFGPSIISIDTIYRSGGNIPEKFLRGCGVPEDFITYMRSLTTKAIEFYSCFISYSSKDEEFAKQLYNDLQSEGVRCWFAPEDLKIGEKLRVRIDEAVRLHDKLLLILSKNSVASQWVEKEVETAFEKEARQKKTVLFPVRLDDAVMGKKTGWASDVRKSRHIGDFRDWKNHDSYKKAFERLMRDLKAGEGR
jgi:hypothetical protein